MIVPILGKGECPCRKTTFEHVTCIESFLQHWPEDFDGCQRQYHPNDIFGLSIDYQEIAELKEDSFRDFTSLATLSLAKNRLETINSAFIHLTKLIELVLTDNNVTFVYPGAFDALVSAKKISLSGNKKLTNIKTRSWTFCHQIKSGTLTIEPEDLKIVADLSLHSAFEEDYCATKQIQETPTVSRCRPDEDSLDCSSLRSNDIHALSCQLKYQDTFEYKSITIDFPIDNQIKPVIPDFSQEFDFFKNLATNEELNRNKANITIRTVVFDIADLEKNTNERTTEEVWIWADVVVISKPVTISYKLKIVARKVFIDDRLSMVMPLLKFKNQQYVTEFEKQYIFKETNIRHRQYGLVEIIDQVPINAKNVGRECQPMKVMATVENTDESWYDETFASMIYIYTFSLLETDISGKKMAVDMANFYTDLYHDKSIVRNDKAFFAANRLSRIQLVSQEEGIIHNVPFYTLNSIKFLASTMHDKLKLYMEIEIRQEEQLVILNARLQDMKVHSNTIDLVMDNYLKMEEQQLNTLFAENSATATFDYQHRQSASTRLSSEIAENRQATISMANIEMNVFKSEADNAVGHYKDVIDKFKEEVERHQAKSDAESRTIKHFNEQFKKSLDNLKDEGDKYKKALEEYKEAQRAKSFWAILTAVVTVVGAVVATVATAGAAAPAALGAGATAAAVSAAHLGAVGSAIGTAATTMEKLQQIGETIARIESLVNLSGPDSTGENLYALIASPSPYFLDVLKQSTELKRAGPLFDDLRVEAEIKLDAQNQATENGIEGIDNFMAAYVTVSNIGNRLTTAAGEYASTTLELVNKKGDMNLGKKDLERATEQVQNIEDAKDVIQGKAEDFNESILKTKQSYEEESVGLIQSYQGASEQRQREIKQQMTERYTRMMNDFASKRGEYFTSLDHMADSLEEKKYGLRLASINHRSMMLTLFNGYCQALYYTAFKQCDQDDKPLLGDKMNVLLDKLFNLKWDSIISKLDVTPQTFNYPVYIEDKADDYPTHLKPIYALKKTYKTTINFKDWLQPRLFDQQWRWRIDEIKISLLDSNDNVITRDDGNRQIQIQVRFPLTFKDKDKNGHLQTFLAQNFLCRSAYTSDPNNPTESCKVDEEFSGNNYKSSPNGAFDLRLLTIGDDSVLLNKLHKLKVVLTGSFIAIDISRRNRRHLPDPEGWVTASNPIGLYTMLAAFAVFFVLSVVIVLRRKKGPRIPGITSEEVPLPDMN